MNPGIGYLVDDRSASRPLVHPAPGIKPVERGEPGTGVGDVDEIHLILRLEIYVIYSYVCVPKPKTVPSGSGIV